MNTGCAHVAGHAHSRLEVKLTSVRCQLEDLAHDLIVAKRAQEEAAHGFAIGHGPVDEDRTRGRRHQGVGDGSDSGVDSVDKDGMPGKGGYGPPGTPDRAGGLPSGAPLPEGREEHVGGNVQTPVRARPPSASRGAPGADGGGNKSVGTKATSEHIEEPGRSPMPRPSRGAAPDGEGASSGIIREDGAASPRRHHGQGGSDVGQIALPGALIERVEARAMPLADGVSCAAFHALAAEAVWAGFSGSDRVERPPESVWRARGGDRWGAAAFFAEHIGGREEEVAPGLPRSTTVVFDKEGNERSVPLSESSARHSSARRARLAAVSARRGFVKRAMRTAAEEVGGRRKV